MSTAPQSRPGLARIHAGQMLVGKTPEQPLGQKQQGGKKNQERDEFGKGLVLVLVSRMLPSRPPTRLTGRKRRSQGRMGLEMPAVTEQAAAHAEHQGQRAGGIGRHRRVPKASRVGKVNSVPPPATALIAPAATADPASPAISHPVIVMPQPMKPTRKSTILWRRP